MTAFQVGDRVRINVGRHYACVGRITAAHGDRYFVEFGTCVHDWYSATDLLDPHANNGD